MRVKYKCICGSGDFEMDALHAQCSPFSHAIARKHAETKHIPIPILGNG